MWGACACIFYGSIGDGRGRGVKWNCSWPQDTTPLTNVRPIGSKLLLSELWLWTRGSSYPFGHFRAHIQIYTRGWKRVCVYLTCLKSHLVCNQAKQIWALRLQRRYACVRLTLRMGKLEFVPPNGNTHTLSVFACVGQCVCWCARLTGSIVSADSGYNIVWRQGITTELYVMLCMLHYNYLSLNILL